MAIKDDARAELERWQVIAKVRRKKLEDARNASDEANDFVEVWEKASLSFDRLDMGETSAQQQLKIPKPNPARSLVDLDAKLGDDDYVPNWLLMAAYVQKRGGRAKATEVRNHLRQLGRLGGKAATAYNQVYQDAKRKDDVFAVLPRAVIELRDRERDYSQEVTDKVS